MLFLIHQKWNRYQTDIVFCLGSILLANTISGGGFVLSCKLITNLNLLVDIVHFLYRLSPHNGSEYPTLIRSSMSILFGGLIGRIYSLYEVSRAI